MLPYDSFINAIFLYDDRVIITFNYKDGTKEVTFKDLRESGLGSDLTALAAPKNPFAYANGFFYPSRRRVYHQKRLAAFVYHPP